LQQSNWRDKNFITIISYPVHSTKRDAKEHGPLPPKKKQQTTTPVEILSPPGIYLNNQFDTNKKMSSFIEYVKYYIPTQEHRKSMKGLRFKINHHILYLYRIIKIIWYYACFPYTICLFRLYRYSHYWYRDFHCHYDCSHIRYRCIHCHRISYLSLPMQCFSNRRFDVPVLWGNVLLSKIFQRISNNKNAIDDVFFMIVL